MKTKSANRYRVCAVCNKRHAPTLYFRKILERYGISGDRAAIACVLKQARLQRANKQELDQCT